MKEERYIIALDQYDRSIVIHALNTLRTQQVQKNKSTEPIDDLIIKVAHAPLKRMRGASNAERL